MYRVFNNYVDNPPPYDCKPPASLKEGVDYQVSYGASYYDSTWRGPNGEEGAMMEYYDEWSLPIFPMDNHFSSAFISLGDNAYFLTFDKDRPKGMPPICLFSDLNHPPRRDFIKHLPYSLGDSQQLGGRVQGYSFWTNPEPDKPPIQVGASPDRTADGGILFGYAFKSAWEPDTTDPSAPPYRHLAVLRAVRWRVNRGMLCEAMLDFPPHGEWSDHQCPITLVRINPGAMQA
jgi:hypothetical protein